MPQIDKPAETWPRVLKRLKLYVYILGTVICCGITWLEVIANGSDLLALHWHLKHGFKTSCCGLQIEVPLKYRPDEGGQWGIFLSDMPGRFRSMYFGASLSMISIIPTRRTETLEQGQVEKDIWRHVSFQKDQGCTQGGVNTIQTAGTHVQCYDFECPSILGFEHRNLFARAEAECFGDGFRASFVGGSKEQRAEFYGVLKTLKRVQE
jgi:hypothetical protein